MKCETAVLQSESELQQFKALMKTEDVKSYLEIGCKFGGSLWHVGKDLPGGSRIVGVDLPHADGSFKQSQPHLEECVGALKAKGYDAHLILGDSRDPDVIEKVYALGPFDACFIDGGHMETNVREDFANYRKCTTKFVAFHDIGYWRPPEQLVKKHIQVPRVWLALKNDFRHVEFRHEKKDCGIGVLWL